MTDPLHVLLVGNFRPDDQMSMLRFETLLAQGLERRGHRVSRAAPAPGLARLARPYRYGGWPKYAGYVDKFVLFPRRLRRLVRRLRPDVVHIVDHANAVYARHTGGVPGVITCHDLLQVQLALGRRPGPAPGRAGRLFQRWILRHLRGPACTVCVSQQTRRDFLELTGRPEDAVMVVPNGLNFPFQRQPAERARALLAPLCTRRGIPADALDSFVLNVAGTQWYKNRAGLLAIYGRLRGLLARPPSLLLVGKDQPLPAGGPTGVHATGPVSDAELEALYSLADGLIFPSLAEGFGWPVAEAQACGCPVFTSNRAPMTEVGGDAAIYFDPAVPASAAQAIADAWPHRASLSVAGRARAELWSPERMIAGYEQAYRHCLARKAAAAPA